MEALRAASFQSFHSLLISSTNSRTKFEKPIFHIPFTQETTLSSSKIQGKRENFKIFTAVSPTQVPSNDESIRSFIPDQKIETEGTGGKFDWYAQWYPLAPLCDLDKRRPHGKKVIGIDVVIWWDRNENEWRVFDDRCPHRLAPLSEGRIDQWGRLQCVYHGWCFGGSGDCKFIPQAPPDGPPVHASKKACAAAYPSCVQNDILWFWPNSDPQYKHIFSEKKPPFIPELDDPSFGNTVICRDIPYGYEVLIENLMDPAHLPYAHYGIIRTAKTPERQADREGGGPLEISLEKLDVNGFTTKDLLGLNFFIPPCVYCGVFSPEGGQRKHSTSSARNKDELTSPVPPEKKELLIFFCIPVSPGNSRLIFATGTNFATWIYRVLPRWIFHMGINLVVDSDLYLLHVEESKLLDVGPPNWHKSCYVPTKSDLNVVSFRRWLNKYGGSQFDWREKFSRALPPTPAREQLFDRYWTHTVSCSSCNLVYKSLNALEIALQVISFSSLIGIAAVTKQGVISMAARNALVCMAVLCFAGSKWLSHFIYKTFRYHDYDHAFH